MKEKMKINESLEMNNDGSLSFIAGNHLSGKFVGVVETSAYNGSGRLLFKRRDENEIILPGSIFVLEQMFKTVSSDRRLHPTSINTGIADYGTINLTGSWNTPANINSESVFGFMVGNGGATASGAVAVNYTNTSLVASNGNASFIPFRIVNASVTQPTGYRFSVLNNGSRFHYIKNFTTDPSISVVDNVACATMTLDVTAQEFREYFTAAGITGSAGVNQLGLVAGYYNNLTQTYDDIKLITTLNFTTIDLTGDTHFSMTYKVYCM